MKYLKLFEAFDDTDYELIFSYLKDRRDISVTIGGDMGDFDTTIITIEAKESNSCPVCDGEGTVVEVMYDRYGDRYKDDVDCLSCDGEGETVYFKWSLIKDTIINFSEYVDADYYVEYSQVEVGYTTDVEYSLPMSEFIEKIKTNPKMNYLKDFAIIINDKEDN